MWPEYVHIQALITWTLHYLAFHRFDVFVLSSFVSLGAVWDVSKAKKRADTVQEKQICFAHVTVCDILTVKKSIFFLLMSDSAGSKTVVIKTSYIPRFSFFLQPEGLSLKIQCWEIAAKL